MYFLNSIKREWNLRRQLTVRVSLDITDLVRPNIDRLLQSSRELARNQTYLLWGLHNCIGTKTKLFKPKHGPLQKPGPKDRNISTQHYWIATYNIVGQAFASLGQTIATFQRNILQHCWARRVARVVWLPCRDVLPHVRCFKSNYYAYPSATLLART